MAAGIALYTQLTPYTSLHTHYTHYTHTHCMQRLVTLDSTVSRKDREAESCVVCMVGMCVSEARCLTLLSLLLPTLLLPPSSSSPLKFFFLFDSHTHTHTHTQEIKAFCSFLKQNTHHKHVLINCFRLIITHQPATRVYT